jgi:acyl carrier protein
MEDSFTRLKNIISDHLRIDPSTIKLEDNFEEDLGADSLDVVEMIILIEQEFMIDVHDEIASEIKTVQELVSYVERFSRGRRIY